MTLVLTTEANPGDADWTDSSVISGGDTLLLIVVAPVDAAFIVDPEDLRNIVYVMAGTVNAITIELPAITPTLPAVWRITVAGGADGATGAVSAAAGDAIINVGTEPAIMHGEIVEGGAAAAANGIFVHDGVSSWACWGLVQSS